GTGMTWSLPANRLGSWKTTPVGARRRRSGFVPLRFTAPDLRQHHLPVTAVDRYRDDVGGGGTRPHIVPRTALMRPDWRDPHGVENALPTPCCALLPRPPRQGAMALEGDLGAGVGLLQLHAPIAQIGKGDRLTGDGAADEIAGRDDLKLAVEIAQSRLAP